MFGENGNKPNPRVAWIWGKSSKGRLGTETKKEEKFIATPFIIDPNPGAYIVDVACGSDNTFFIFGDFFPPSKRPNLQSNFRYRKSFWVWRKQIR